MSLISEKTQVETDTEEQDKAILIIGQKAHEIAFEMVRAYNKFWALPDDRLIAVMNRKGPQMMSKIFAQNTALGVAVNAALDSFGDKYKNRVPVEPKRNDIGINEKGEFYIIEPELEPSPEDPEDVELEVPEGE